MISLFINPAEATPIYRQIERQIIESIAGGRLKPGDRLPSHRELAEELVIAPLTVKKAYDELERSGYITIARGNGTFVQLRPPQLNEDEILERIRPLAKRLVHESHLAGLTRSQTLAIVQEELAELPQQRHARRRGEKP